MPLFPLPIEQFAGLNLVGAIDEEGFSGAIDMLNIDLDHPGVVRSRDGFAKFTAAAAASRYTSLAPYYTTLLGGGVAPQLVAAKATGGIDALTNAGALVASDATMSATPSGPIFARFGTPGSEFVYAGDGGSNIVRFNGTVWATPTATVDGVAGKAMPRGAPYLSGLDNRLVATCFQTGSLGPNAAASSPSYVYWSEPGDAETWKTTNFLQLTPGDGEAIAGAIRWRDLFFVFKQSRFFVFYGTDIDATGQPIFNYRMIEGVGMFKRSTFNASHAVAATPNAVYFANERGIWATTGGPAQLISEAVDPVFRGSGASSVWGGGTLNQAAINNCSLTWYDRRLYFSYPTGSSTVNDSTLVFDPEQGQWLYWNMPIQGACSFHPTAQAREELFFSLSSGTNDIARYNTTSGYIQDGGDGLTTGAAITSRYQSGYDNIAPPRRFAAHYLFGNTRKRLRKWKVTGSGTVSIAIAHDFKTAGTASTLTLGTPPAIADKWHNIATRGQLLSYKLSSTAAWSVQKLTAYLAGSEPPLLGNPSDK